MDGDLSKYSGEITRKIKNVLGAYPEIQKNNIRVNNRINEIYIEERMGNETVQSR